MESKTEHSENPFLQKETKKERKAPKSFDDQTRTTISSHKLPLRPGLRKTTDEKAQVMKRKANTECKSPVPRLQTRKKAFFMRILLLRGHKKLQTTPIFGRFPREKKSSVTQTSKQASKQDSTLDQRQDTKNPSTKATAIRELGATRRRRRRRRSDACWD
jgi:hypothetical protein